MPPLESVDDRWNALLRLTRSWRLEWNLEQLLSRVAREAVDFLSLERSIIFLLEQKGLSPRAAWPEQTLNSPEQFYTQGFKIAQQVVEFGRPIYGHQLSQARENDGARSVCCVPLTASRGILGALYADSSKSVSSLTQKDQEFLEMLGLQAAVALEHAVLYQSAITDPLTRLFSHRHFQQEVEQALRRANRSGQPLSLLLMDLDHFKALNDNCGHEAGNQCLMQVASILRQTLRVSDVLARFGGDEFEILLPDTPLADAVAVAEKIRPKIGAIPLPQNRQVTATFGVAAFPDNAADAQAIFLRADEALYVAKEAGRNRTTASTHKEKGTQPAEVIRTRPDGIDSLAMLMSPRYQKPAAAPVDIQARAAESVDGHPVVKRLGAGSTGEVLLVRQPELNRDIALKRLLTAQVTEAQMRAFEEEARLTASLRHPGIVTVHTMGTDVDGRRYYTMVPLAGQSLAEIFERRRGGHEQTLKAFTMRRLMEILQRASETLAYAHQRDVVHLDLSPGNVVVGDFGEVSVIDWGRGAASRATAAPAASESSMSLLIGSPSYLAPERLPGSGAIAGPAADVFALGALLYEVLTGQPPFFNQSTREAMDALIKGKIPPPEAVVPEAGLDPSISALCMQALSRKPEERPSALEFSQRLGRFVRNEPEWTVTKFGPDQHPLVESEWITASGRWTIHDGVFAPQGEDEHIIYWKVPTGGSYRFVAEAWCECATEMSLMSSAAAAFQTGKMQHSGYYFQFGAEYHVCTKFSRHGKNLIARMDLLPEVGRHYILSIEYDEDEGIVSCFVDGKLAFRVRELFPFTGRHVGLYAYAEGARLKPLEVHSRNWTLQIQSMRVADEHYNAGRYEEALRAYQEIERRVPNRLEGLEARLKAGMSNFANPEEARETLESLFGTTLEPYALAELGLLDIQDRPGINPWRGLMYMRKMLEEFPGHLAGERILHACEHTHWTYGRWGSTMQEDAAIRHEFNLLGSRTGQAVTFSQIRTLVDSMNLDFELGRWRTALNNGSAAYQRLSPRQQGHHTLNASIYVAALACGIESLSFPLFDGFEVWYTERCDWPSGVLIHRLIRTGKLAPFLEEMQDPEHVLKRKGNIPIATVLGLIEAGRLAPALDLLERLVERSRRSDESVFRRAAYLLVVALVESGHYDEARRVVDSSKTLTQASDETRALLRIINVRAYLEQGNLEAAARALDGAPLRFEPFVRIEDDVVLLTLLSSLKLVSHPSRDDIRAHVQNSVCGPELELCEIFLGRREPRPPPAFPHPGWRPEWRLWLALWLEAKGERKAAKEIAEPAIDPRYNRMHSQVALKALLARVGS
ncbi:MAG TPA: diguanylate cyclase [Planctomycetota bacterium]|nr:diguanylate cyclase [Planctomycetota bacterium]